MKKTTTHQKKLISVNFTTPSSQEKMLRNPLPASQYCLVRCSQNSTILLCSPQAIPFISSNHSLILHSSITFHSNLIKNLLQCQINPPKKKRLSTPPPPDRLQWVPSRPRHAQPLHHRPPQTPSPILGSLPLSAPETRHRTRTSPIGSRATTHLTTRGPTGAPFLTYP